MQDLFYAFIGAVVGIPLGMFIVDLIDYILSLFGIEIGFFGKK